MPTPRVTCSGCGASISRLSERCFSCSLPTSDSLEHDAAPTTRACPACEADISITARRCRYCGELVLGSGATAALAPAVASSSGGARRLDVAGDGDYRKA